VSSHFDFVVVCLSYAILVRDRLLLENEPSIIAMQCLARSFLIRKAQATQRIRLRLAERYVPKLQARCRGTLTRRRVEADRRQQMDLIPWAIALQAAIRSSVARQQWQLRLRRLRASAKYVIQIQAQSRGVIQRRRFAQLKAAMRKSTFSIVKLQSLARAQVARKAHKEVAKTFGRRVVFESIVALQAHARGSLARREVANWLASASEGRYCAETHAKADG
jgi:Ras GTPase-activating-like protein IQGAP2/3